MSGTAALSLGISPNGYPADRRNDLTQSSTAHHAMTELLGSGNGRWSKLNHWNSDMLSGKFERIQVSKITPVQHGYQASFEKNDTKL
jgi:hypothetical protein